VNWFTGAAERYGAAQDGRSGGWCCLRERVRTEKAYEYQYWKKS
jgi:hypothetical protein